MKKKITEKELLAVLYVTPDGYVYVPETLDDIGEDDVLFADCGEFSKDGLPGQINIPKRRKHKDVGTE